ncbi:MAG: beta-eliminating lyase-related protein [Chloroflexota bacterium]|nr:beta-eliminating lyase-related protein [Chloroflexota bacterium]
MIDLSSDTATRPTAEMRAFMAAAPVGDEQRREDPSVNELQALTAAITGKEAALFLPSGTMCNVIAYAVHCGRGETVILDQDAHPNIAEQGQAAIIGNVLLRTVAGERGIFTVDQIQRYIHPGSTHAARSGLISVENTSNRGGGAIWPLARLAELRALADANDMKLHMDGARLMNAVVASGHPATAFASYTDSVWVDLSKGLGAPVGAVLAGSGEFIETARRWKHLLGGAMRQAGIIAAAGTYAFRHHVDRLVEDHANARLLADGLASIPVIDLVYAEIPTNIVYFDVKGTGLMPMEIEARINQQGVRIGGAYGQSTVMRAVTHLDVSRDDCEQAVAAVRAACLTPAAV